MFVGVVTLAFAIAGQIGVGAQEAFQLIDNAAGIFYAFAYLVLFAIPIFGMRAMNARAPLWLRLACWVGGLTTVLYIIFTIFPIVEVESRASFAAKIIVTVIAAQLIGTLIFVVGKRGKPTTR